MAKGELNGYASNLRAVMAGAAPYIYASVYASGGASRPYYAARENTRDCSRLSLRSGAVVGRQHLAERHSSTVEQPVYTFNLLRKTFVCYSSVYADMRIFWFADVVSRCAVVHRLRQSGCNCHVHGPSVSRSTVTRRNSTTYLRLPSFADTCTLFSVHANTLTSSFFPSLVFSLLISLTLPPFLPLAFTLSSFAAAPIRLHNKVVQDLKAAKAAAAKQ